MNIKLFFIVVDTDLTLIIVYKNQLQVLILAKAWHGAADYQYKKPA